MTGAASQGIIQADVQMLQSCVTGFASDTIQQTERAKLMPDMTTKLHKFISMHLLQWRPNMAAHIIYTDV